MSAPPTNEDAGQSAVTPAHRPPPHSESRESNPLSPNVPSTESVTDGSYSSSATSLRRGSSTDSLRHRSNPSFTGLSTRHSDVSIRHTTLQRPHATSTYHATTEDSVIPSTVSRADHSFDPPVLSSPQPINNVSSETTQEQSLDTATGTAPPPVTPALIQYSADLQPNGSNSSHASDGALSTATALPHRLYPSDLRSRRYEVGRRGSG